MEEKKITLICQKCKKFISLTQKEWIDHYKKKHKDVKNLRVGPELVKLQDGTKTKK